MATASDDGLTIEISDCVSSEETVELYFENERRSGGGNIVEVIRKGHTFFVTFEDPKVASRVVSRPHSLEGVGFAVKLSTLRNIDSRRLLVKRISRSTTNDGLGYFLKDVTGSDVIHIHRYDDKKSAVVTFKNAINVKMVIDDFDHGPANKRVLDGATLRLLPLDETSTILTIGLPHGITTEWLQLYFENTKRSGGGDVQEVSVAPDGTTAKVIFTDPATVHRVLQRAHTYKGKVLSLAPFHEIGDCEGADVSCDHDVEEGDGMSQESKLTPVKVKPSVPEKQTASTRPEYTVPIDNDILHFIEADKKHLDELREAMTSADATTTREIGEETIRVVATKDINVASDKQDWEVRSQEALVSVFGEYSKINVPVVQHVWQSVLTDLEAVPPSVLKVKRDDEKHEIQFVGKTPDVEQARNKIQQTVKDHLEEMDRESSKITKISKHSKGRLYVLKQQLDAIGARHKNVKIEIDQKARSITFNGGQNDVNRAMCDVYEVSNSLVEKRFPLKRCLTAFLQGDSGKQKLYRILREKKSQTGFEVDGSEVIITATSADQIKSAHEVVQRSFKVDEVACNLEMLLEKEDFHVLVTSVQENFTVEINFDNMAIIVVGLSGDVDSAKSKLTDYTQANMKTSELVNADPNIIRYIKTHKNEAVHESIRKLYHAKGKMTYKETGILLEGSPDVTREAKRKLAAMVSEIERTKKEIRMKNRGQCKLFFEGRGEDLAKSIEHKVPCVIHVRKQGNLTKRKESHGLVTSRPVSGKRSSSTLERKGKKISVRQGNIAEERVDVIINSISDDMDNPFKGGISRAIFAKGGEDILSALRCFDALQVGDVKVTTSGNLKCKEVYHCVLGRWNHGKGKRVLQNIVKEAFYKASQSGHKSIAFPGLGTGFLGFPHHEAAEVMFNEALNFSHKDRNSNLKDIRFIMFDSENVDAFQRELGSHGHAHSDHDGSAHAHVTASATTGETTQATLGRISVEVIQGDLTKQNIDAIVNPVIPNTFDQGQVGIAIVKAAGDVIQNEYERSKHDLIHGPIITGAGNIRTINSVIHIVCPKAPALQRTVVECLQLVDSCLQTTVAMPAIGSGHFGLSPTESARGILEGVKQFATTNPESLKTVKIVIFQAAMVSDFARILGEISQQPAHGARHDGNESRTTGKHRASHDPPEVTITIFADNDKDISKAQEEVKKIVDEEVITDYIVNELISKLNDDELKHVKAIGNINHVDVSVDTIDGTGVLHKLKTSFTGQDKVLRLKGLKLDVATYRTHIDNWLQKLSAAKEMQKSVKWYYFQDGRQRKEFNAMWNFDLETARLTRDSRIDLIGEDGKPAYHVDLKAMKETHLKTKRKFSLHREGPDDSNVKYPKEWSSFPSGHKDDEPLRVPLRQGSREYKDVEGNFRTKAGNVKVTVQKIERIQHKLQYEIYSLRKRAMTQKYPRQEIEKTLYHGTKSDAVGAIIKGGFNRSYAGSSVGAREGDGVYFAVQSEYSLKNYYSPPDQNGQRFMFQVKVLVGKSCRGTKGMKEPDLIQGTNDRYDTTTNNVNNPIMFVTFHDEQAYPEFLITFK